VARAYLGLGSNVGDLRANLDFARRGLEAGGITILEESQEETTAPVGGVEQPDFLNQALEVETELDPMRLLELCKLIEERAGRARDGVHWGPRVLDIDILLYEGVVVESPALTIPHPELERRAFVLRQLLELDADLIDPRGNVPLAELLRLLVAGPPAGPSAGVGGGS